MPGYTAGFSVGSSAAAPAGAANAIEAPMAASTVIFHFLAACILLSNPNTEGSGESRYSPREYISHEYSDHTRSYDGRGDRTRPVGVHGPGHDPRWLRHRLRDQAVHRARRVVLLVGQLRPDLSRASPARGGRADQGARRHRR